MGDDAYVAWGSRPGSVVLEAWFDAGRRHGSRFMIVYQDTFDAADEDWGIFPSYFDTLEEAKASAAYQATNAHRLLEIYDLRIDFFEQNQRPSLKDPNLLEP